MTNNKSFIVSYNIPDAWEVWHIELTPEGQEAFDSKLGEDYADSEAEEWLEANPEFWDHFDLKDRGGSQMSDFILEGEL